MHTFLQILQILSAVGLLILMAVQTEKAEQGGVMGIGGAGGNSSGEIDMAVGAERILKPLTKWVAIGFLFLSVLSAIPVTSLTFWQPLVAVVLYLAVMLFGNVLWMALTGTRR